MKPAHPALMSVTAAMLMPAALLAQQNQPGATIVGGLRWTPAQPTVSDASPLNVNQGVPLVDLRATSSFDRLYKLDEKPRLFSHSSGDYYMRRSGAVAAIFPRSSYVQTPDGVMAEIPPGTVFSIGGRLDEVVGLQPATSARPTPVPAGPGPAPGATPAGQAASGPQPAAPARPQPPQRPDYRVPTETTPAAKPTSPATPSSPRTGPAPTRPATTLATEAEAPAAGKSIWSDPVYRSQRLEKLLSDAASR